MTTPDETLHGRDRLLFLCAGPIIWFLHFMFCYVTAAVWCAKFANAGEPLGGVRVAIALYTAVALFITAAIAQRAWRQHRFGHASLPHDDDTPEDRHRFLGFATLLLSGLSFVAIVYSALAAVFIGDCS